MSDNDPVTQKQYREHAEEDARHFAERPTKEEMKIIVNDALTEFFVATGKSYKGYLLGAAVIIGSLTVIFGGLKALLGWLGFVMMK